MDSFFVYFAVSFVSVFIGMVIQYRLSFRKKTGQCLFMHDWKCFKSEYAGSYYFHGVIRYDKCRSCSSRRAVCGNNQKPFVNWDWVNNIS